MCSRSNAGIASRVIPHTDNGVTVVNAMTTVGAATTPNSLGGGLSMFACHRNTEHPSQTISTPHTSEVDREEATMDLQAVNWEHHGPGSWLSICSPPGLQWVSAKTGTTRFHQIAETLVMDWTSKLTLSPGRNRERSTEPGTDHAWAYVSAYFERSQDRVFGVVLRSDFETRLRVHLQNGSKPQEDAAWYALRNAVGLMAVQALIVMTAFAELLGSPAIEYMLCASAARLAQSKGLHRQPSKTWTLPKSEMVHRNWVFWAAYYYDKNIALRSGRPPSFNDDEISCEIPSELPDGSTTDINLVTSLIEHARICAKISKELFSVQVFNKPPMSLIDVTEKLEEILQLWKNSIPSHPSLTDHIDCNLSSKIYPNQENTTRLHYLYWGSIISLHANFHYPWICSLLTHQETLFESSISKSSARSAEASRQILSILDSSWFDTSFTSSIVFYYPMLAVINLFIYILKAPSLDTVPSDLALLDLAAGHFARVHFLTSAQVSFTFAREVVGLANKAVRRTALAIPNNNRKTPNVYTPDISPVNNTGDSISVFDSNPSFEDFNTLSAEFFEGLSSAGDMIIFESYDM
ncbi:fungal-specific transcription factor domain-containing protein [Penicillium verhagenii]|nr:fungal-specific transcription factor domain-containing protein [Penicillium verhagenii]